MAGGMLTLPLRHTAYPRGTLTDFGAGYRVDGSDGPSAGPAPRLGQHTRELLLGVGIQGAAIDTLSAEGKLRA